MATLEGSIPTLSFKVRKAQTTWRISTGLFVVRHQVLTLFWHYPAKTRAKLHP